MMIRRQETWTSPKPLSIPKTSVDHTLVYIPEGQCEVGHISGQQGAWMKQNIYVDAFWIQRYPVTHQEYLDFLNNLVDKGQRTIAAQCTPPTERFKYTDELLVDIIYAPMFKDE